MKQIATTLAAALAVALAATAHGQTDRRWDGSAGDTYNNVNNWTDPNVPNTNSEAILVDGDNASRTWILFDVDATVGQLRVVTPATTVRLQTARTGTKTLTLSPGQFFDGVGIDMSAATKNFAISYYSQESGRLLNLDLASSQEWKMVNHGLQARIHG